MMAPTKYDYALIRRLIEETPALEKNMTHLHAAYAAAATPDRAGTREGLRMALKHHGRAILGRLYEPGPTQAPTHDRDVVRQILAGDVGLMRKPAKVAAVYTERTGKAISPGNMSRIIHEVLHPGEPPAESAAAKEAVDRFGEMLRIYRQLGARDRDVLHGGEWAAYYADLLADGIHWAMQAGISPTKAMNAAWDTVTLERAQG